MKMNARLSILFWLNGKATTDQQKSLYARLTIDGLRAELSLGRKIPVDLWNQDSGQLKGNSADSLQANRYISDVKLKLEKIYDLLEYQHSIVTSVFC